MTDKINELLRRVEEFEPKAAAEIEEFRIRILGKKGELNALMEEFKTVAPELKRELGQHKKDSGCVVDHHSPGCREGEPLCLCADHECGCAWV